MTPIDPPTIQECLDRTPFVISEGQVDVSPGGYFRPCARVILTPALRTSGFWMALPGEELKTLLLLMTFVSANGWCRPSIQELSHAMAVSEAKARSRLGRLTAARWNGVPVVREVRRDSGMDTYAPTEAVVVTSAEPVNEPYRAPAAHAAGRETVIAYSRDRYTRPRAEVERQIAEMNGWPTPEEMAARGAPREPEEPERAELRRALHNFGLIDDQIDIYFAQYPLDRIRQQIEWMPYRNARDRTRFLAAAIDEDYEAPRHLPPPSNREQPVSGADT